MSFPVTFALIVAGLIVSAHERLRAVVFGLPVDMPWLGIIAAVLVLSLAALVLVLLRLFLRDGLGLRPHLRTA